MLKFGSNTIGKVYLGSNVIGKAYLGSNLVYQSNVAPVDPPVFYDYLIFDGTAYIDTNVIPPADASFRVNLGNETATGAQRWFQVAGTNSSLFGVVANSESTASRRQLSVFYGSSSSLSTNQVIENTMTSFNFFLTPNRFGRNNTVLHTITKGSGTPNEGLILGSNVAHNGNAYTGAMKTFRIYGSDAKDVTTDSGFDNYTPVATLRPCVWKGEVGMWHVERNRFYGNSAGSGTLTVSNNE